MSIRKKMIGVISLLILIPIIVIGGSSYIKASALLNENYINSNQALNNEIANALENEFDGYMMGIQSIADNVDAREILDKPEYEPFLLSLFENYVNNYRDAFQMYIGTKDGVIRIYPSYDFDESYDPRKSPWYTLVEEKEAPGWTDMYEDAVTGNWSLSGSAPVYNMENEFIGAVAISLDLSGISKMIDEITVGKEGYVFVLNNKGNVIAHPDPSQIGKRLNVDEIQQVISEKKKEGIVDYKFTNGDGEMADKYAIYKYMPETGWYIMTSMYYDEISDSTGTLLNYALIIGLITLIIAIIIAFLFSNSITKPIQRIVKDMSLVENGDMTIQSGIKSKDEIGELASKFNSMVKNVRGLLENAKSVALDVANEAEHLAASSEQASASADEVTLTIEEIAEGATDQAHDTDTSVKLTENLDKKIENLHENSETITTDAKNVKEVNENGIEVINDLKEKSNENNVSTQKIASAIQNLAEKSENIGGILATISDISEQTNLLALNASIEAARAGEHGKGFAVVADEIRKLAEESAKSAAEIGEIIKVIQMQTNETVEIMNVFKENSSLQYKAVEKMDESFDDISESIINIVEQITNVNRFITDMIKDKDAIVESIMSISTVSSQTAAASQEVSASMSQQNLAVDEVAKSATQLNQLSEDLQKQIEKFTI